MKKIEHNAYRLFVNCLLGTLLRILYRVRVTRSPDLPDGPILVVANHRHFNDVIAVHTSATRWIYWVSKKENINVPVIGTLIRMLGAIPVDREKVDLVAARGIFGRLKAGEAVGIFPQGTRVPDSRLAQITPHAGAAHFAIKTGVPIVPVWIDPFRLFRPVRVIFGSPFQLSAEPRAHYSHEQLQAYSCEIMQKVFALAGKTYPCLVPAAPITPTAPADQTAANGHSEAQP